MSLTNGVKSYEEVVLLDKLGTFKEKMNLLPIAQDELRNNPNLTQTPEW